MPNFTLKVGTPDGQIIEREFHAHDIKEASEEARRHGLHVFQARRRGLNLSSLVPRSRKVISTDRFLLFNQELLALVKAGLPILQSFDIMLERQKNARFREVLTDIRDKIKSGVAISDAFASYGDQFPAIYSTSIRAGERSGDLEGVLRRFLRYQKLIVALRKKVISAMIYPSVIASVSVGMIIVMLTVVIPKFSEFYQGFGAELPLVTRTLITIAFGVRSNFLLFVVGVAAIVFLVKNWARTSTGGEAFDRFKLSIPLVGGVLHRFSILQFTQSLATLLGGGTPMVPAIEIASQSITNKYISRKVMDIVQNVREGEALWHSLEKTDVMSDLAVEMIKVGESTGALVEMLSNVSEFYDEEIDAMLGRIISMIEPIILVILGCLIAGLLYAFYLPLFELTNVQQY